MLSKLCMKRTQQLFSHRKGKPNSLKSSGVLQDNPLAPFLFVIVLDFAFRKSINDTGIMLIRRQSRRHPPIHLADLDFADDIMSCHCMTLLDETISEAERVLSSLKVEAETQFIGFYC